MPKEKDSKTGVQSLDLLASALLMLVRHYRKPFTLESLLTGLPLADGRLTPRQFVRAAQRAGLRARVSNRKARHIAPHVLPAVVFNAESKPRLLIKLTDLGVAQVLDPESQKITEYNSFDDFSADYNGTMILVRPASAAELAPDVLFNATGWFWDTLKQFWPLYSQVILAAVVINLLALVSPLFIMNVYDRVVPNAAYASLWVLAIGAIMAFGFDFLLRQLRGYFIDIAGRGADILLSSAIFQQLMNLRLGENRMRAGVMANQVREFETLREFFASATLATLVDLPFVFLFIGVIAMIGGPVALIPLLMVPLVLVVAFAVQAPMQKLVMQMHEDFGSRHGHLVESINGLEVIKALNAQGRMQATWEQHTGILARFGTQMRFMAQLGMHFSMFATNMTIVLVVVWGVYLVTAGDMSIGALVASSILVGRAMAPLSQAVALYVRYEQAQSALQSLKQLMAQNVERPDGKESVHVPQFKGAIEFKDVDFHYPDTPINALHQISFKIKPGERVAIIGRSGSGKTTLTRLVLGLYEPNGGSILLDGLELRQLDVAEVRRDVAFVPQNTSLFNGTLRENIMLGNAQADEEQFTKAAVASGVQSFAARHPLGFDLPVGELGQNLSGGQRQMVAIARALLRQQAPIAVLDDPSSELDNRTEDHVKRHLKQWVRGRTVLLITHRATMLELVDRVIVVDYGKIVADGPREQVVQALRENKIKVAQS